MAEADRPARIRIAPADLPAGANLVPVTVGGHRLVLVRDAGRIVAVERACPHEGADLSLGQCVGGRLRCPRHRASFDLEDGSVSPGWSFRALRLLPVEMASDGLWVRLA